MRSSGDRRPSLTRRDVLAGAAGLATGLAYSARPARPTAAVTPTGVTATAMTQNVYVGVDLFELVNADSVIELVLAVEGFLDDLDPARYEARARGIVAGIADAEPDVVALQEVALIEPADSDSPENADDSIDFLARIESALRAANLDYEVAAETVTTDVELPGFTDDLGVRVANRDVLLVHSDHTTTGVETDTYDATTPVEIPGTDSEIAVTRGYCAVDVVMERGEFTAVSTHLESASNVARRQQARELLDSLPEDRPVALCGDFNTGPGTVRDTYELLTASFEDPHAALEPDRDGFTCCQAPDLTNDDSQLDRRIDGVLARGDVQPTAVHRVGHEPEDRVAVESDDGTVRLWPSDHAGVVGTFELTDVPPATPQATATATETPTATTTATATTTDTVDGSETTPAAKTESPSRTATTEPTRTPDRTADGDGAGFGLVSVLAALGSACYALKRRVERE